MPFTFRPIPIAIDAEPEALLVLNDEGGLAAVLVRLEAFHGPELEGRWFLEAGFGRYEANDKVFATIEDAKHWLLARAEDALTGPH